MRHAYDLLAIDLDGTLLDSAHSLSAENRCALHRAHEAGLRIVLCTGRAYPETLPILEQVGLDLDAAVTVFGAVVTDVPTARTIERAAIPLPVALRASDWFGDQGYAVLWLNDADEIGFDGYVVDGPRRHPAVDRWVERSPCAVRCVDALPADASAPVRISIIDEPDTLAPVSQALTRHFDGELTHNLLRAPAWDLTIIETFAPHVNKWYGIEWLCKKWQIEPGRTVAVGDDVNDRAMIQRAGLGVAMGNAREEIKRLADRVAPENDDHGVAALIHDLLDT